VISACFPSGATSGRLYYPYGDEITSTSNDGATSAFVGTRNASDQSAIFAPDVLPPSITVNNNRVFCNTDYTVGSQRYAGGSVAAQIFILIHELAHQAGAAGFLPDAGLPTVGGKNGS